MKKNFIYLLCAVIMGSLLQVQAQNSLNTGDLNGQERVNAISTAVPLLTISPNASAGAMGDAGAATKPDANSIHWNPAKLAFVEKDAAFSVSYTPWLRALVPDINLAYLSGYKRIDEYQTFGASLLFFSLGNIVFTDITGQETGNFNPHELALDGSYARKLSENFSLGMAARFIYSNLASGQNVNGEQIKPGMSGAVDISGYYTKEVDLGDKAGDIAFGLNISNIGSKISYTNSDERDFIPTNLRLGSYINIELDDYNEIAFTLDFNKLLVPTNPIYDDSASTGDERKIKKGKDPNRSVPAGIFGSFNDAPGGLREELQEIYYAVGMEYWYDQQFALRAGYFYEHPLKGNRQYFTLGAGLKYNVFGLDFAYLIPTTQRNPLENTLRFSLLFDFAAFKSTN